MNTDTIDTSYVQHTPGPWEAVGSLVRTRLTAGEREGLLVADCYRGSYWTPETREANTRLIAAAPDLLAALRDCVRSMEQVGVWHEPAISAARAALERATEG